MIKGNTTDTLFSTMDMSFTGAFSALQAGLAVTRAENGAVSTGLVFLIPGENGVEKRCLISCGLFQSSRTKAAVNRGEMT